MATKNYLVLIMALSLVSLSGTEVLAGATAPQNRNSPEAIPIVVMPDGFQQTTLFLPAGSYAFVVLNRTGFQSLTLRLERMSGNTVAGAALVQEFGERVGNITGRLVKNSRLTPGTYRLRVENRPAWVCAIHVR